VPNRSNVESRRPGTFQIDAVVGHNDSASTPSHFIAMNLDRGATVIEIPGGDPSKAEIYPGPTLIGDGQDLTPVTLTIRDVNGDGKVELLTVQEQRLFRRLSVFIGGCTWQAIEAVSVAFGDDAALVLDVVGSLNDKNLLRQSVQEEEEIRLMLLETIHEYGLEALAASGRCKQPGRHTRPIISRWHRKQHCSSS